MLRPFRPDDRDVVRRWIDDSLITGGFLTAAPGHSDAKVLAIVRGEERHPTRNNYERVKDGWTSTG